MPPEIHQVLDPYLDKLENRLDPNKPFEADFDPRSIVPEAASSPAADVLRQAIAPNQPADLIRR
jgi:hypothetical protein